MHFISLLDLYIRYYNALDSDIHREIGTTAMMCFFCQAH